MTDETKTAEAVPVVEPPAEVEPLIYAPISVTKPGHLMFDPATGKYNATGWGFDLGGRPMHRDWQQLYALDITNAVLQYVAQIVRHGPMRQPKSKK